MLFCIVQFEVCLNADTCCTVDPGVMSLIQIWSHTFVKIAHEIIFTAVLLLSADSRRIVSLTQKNVPEALVNCTVKLAQRKSVVR